MYCRRPAWNYIFHVMDQSLSLASFIEQPLPKHCFNLGCNHHFAGCCAIEPVGRTNGRREMKKKYILKLDLFQYTRANGDVLFHSVASASLENQCSANPMLVYCAHDQVVW